MDISFARRKACLPISDLYDSLEAIRDIGGLNFIYKNKALTSNFQSFLYRIVKLCNAYCGF
jgi:hypothetical protein